MLVLKTLTNGILRLTLNNPPANTLSEAMLDELKMHLAQANNKNEIRAIVIAANGKIFSAGHDLKEIHSHRAAKDKGRAFFQKLMKKCSTVMQAIVQHNKPIIAEINGSAYAAGCQLVASCDLAYASSNATFCTPGVNIGLFCSTPMVALSRNISNKHALEMLLLGEPITATKAAEIGLINVALPKAKLKSNVNQVCQKIKSKPPTTLKIGKKTFYQQKQMNLQQAYTLTAKVMVQNMLHKESIEGIESFTGAG